MELQDPRDQMGRGKTLSSLGLVAYQRFKEARAANRPEEKLLQHLNDAVRFYLQALDLLPPNAVDDLAVVHSITAQSREPVCQFRREPAQHKCEMDGSSHGTLRCNNSMLGTVYGDAGDFDRALVHYREGIRYLESAGNLYNAAIIRSNVAADLASAGRLADAREYALAALRNFETFGERAAEEIEKAKGLIAEIEKRKGKS